MRLLIASALLSVSVPFSAFANIPVEKISFQPQVKGMSCLKPETLAMITELVARIGPIQITSTCGGRHARHSQHYLGKAIDFRPLATSPRKAAAAARTLDSVGGIGTYSNGLLHVDTRDNEVAWSGHKGRRHYTQIAQHER